MKLTARFEDLEDLSWRQRRFLCRLIDFIKAHGYPPTLRDLCTLQNIPKSSTQAVANLLDYVEKKGWISRPRGRFGRARAITVLADPRQFDDVEVNVYATLKWYQDQKLG